MTVTAGSSRFAIAEVLEAHLAGIDGLVTVYRGEVPDKPPISQTDGADDPSGRVAPYAVIYTGGGRLDLNPTLATTPAGLLWTGQITFAAGWARDLEDLLDTALPAVRGWQPTIAGIAVGVMRPPAGFDPGTVRRDDQVRPPRFYLPTLWELQVADATPA